MRARFLSMAVAGTVLIVIGFPTRYVAEPVPGSTGIANNYGNLPLSFEPNFGQTSATYDFLARAAGYQVYLKAGTVLLKGSRTGSPAVHLQLRGANKHAPMTAANVLPGESNYFSGPKERWITHVPNYGSVAARNVYSGIDVSYYGTGNQLEYDFIVHPAAKPDVIDIGFDEASALSVTDGDLVMSIGGFELRQKKPIAYQEIEGVRKPVEARYRILGRNSVGLEIGEYRHDLPLVIDPQLIYSIYLGVAPTAAAIALDNAGDSYIAGATLGDTISDNLGTDAFVMKVNAAGTAVIYRNSFGAKGINDGATAIAVDSSGNAYVTGYTSAAPPFSGRDFPTINPIQNGIHGQDAFITKFDSNGQMVYSTGLGGSGAEMGTGIAVDSAGNMYVTGQTWSSDFPTYHPLQQTFGGQIDVFVTVLNSQGSAFIYSTYVGGFSEDQANAIAIDPNGNAYVTGFTISNDFPTANAMFTFSTTCCDGFLFKLNSSGSAFIYSTYLNDSTGYGVAADSAGNAYVTGSGPFVKKMNPTGSAVVYESRFGDGQANAIAIDGGGNAYITGYTFSTFFPQIGSLETFAGYNSAFATKLDGNGNVVYSTLIGGSSSPKCPNGAPNPYNIGYGIAVDGNGNAYIAGGTGAGNFPTTPNSLNANACNVPSIWQGSGSFLVKITNDPAGGITQVQANSAEGRGVGALSASFASANHAGNLIIAFVRMSTTSQTVTVTDTNRNNYVDAVSQAQTADGHQVHLFYAKNIAAGPNTVTATFSSTNNHPWIAIYEYSGISTTNPLDRTAHAQGSDNSPFTGLIATTSPNELEFAADGMPASYTGTVSTGGGYTLLLQDSGTSRAATEAAILSQTGSNYAGRLFLSAAANWTIVDATFVGQAPPLQMTTRTLPNGTVNAPYSAQISAAGGTAPYSWAVVSSDFPTGLTLDPSSGIISGSPTQSGQFTFTVRLTDSVSNVMYRFFNMTIPAPSSVALVQKNSAEGRGLTSLSLPFQQNTTGGNLIIAFVRMSTASQTVHVQDSSGNVYTDAVSQTQTADGHQVHIFYAGNIAGGSDTVTATFSATNNHPYVAIFEFSGLALHNPLGPTAAAQGSGSSPATAALNLNADTHTLVFAATGLPASYTGTISSGAGYAIVVQDTGTSRAAIEIQTPTSSGSLAGNFSLSNSTNWTAVLASFD